ncbi:hypothetical protein [Streptobacillus canis]|uniref:hypothetical protein n=1 Tax=Streptobacillus canis TaxID=2678686 RepID=UPI0012E19F8E|nr:hypothetical protein [Streptobacillus canis]
MNMITLEIKNIEKEIDLLSEKLTSNKNKVREISRKITGKISEISEKIEMQNDIIKIEKEKISVSNHAILRYLERVIGLDTEEIKNSLINESLLKKFQESGDGEYILEIPNMKLNIKNGTIIKIEEV